MFNSVYKREFLSEEDSIEDCQSLHSVIINHFTCPDKCTIYVHCQKIYNLFVRALETGRIASL